MSQVRQPLEKLRCLGRVGVEAGLGLLGAELDLDQNWQTLGALSRRFIQSLGQAQRIQRVDPVKQFHGSLSFVRLQMTDEMHADGVCGAPAQRAEFSSLGGKLLDAILAEEREAQRGGLGDRGCGISLRHGHQLNFSARAAGAAAGVRDCRFQPFEIFYQRCHYVRS